MHSGLGCFFYVSGVVLISCDCCWYAAWRMGVVSRQTSIMAVAFDGGVVLGADSRTTTGTYIANRVSDKITPMTESIFCCRSGSAADTQAISDYVRYVLD